MQWVVRIYRFGELMRRVWRIEKVLESIRAQGEQIMSAISDFAAKQNQFNTRLGAAIDGVTADLAALNAKIEELQNTPGIITPEDQALLDDLQARGEALAARLEGVDALHPPTPPTA